MSTTVTISPLGTVARMAALAQRNAVTSAVSRARSTALIVGETVAPLSRATKGREV